MENVTHEGERLRMIDTDLQGMPYLTSVDSGFGMETPPPHCLHATFMIESDEDDIDDVFGPVDDVDTVKVNDVKVPETKTDRRTDSCSVDTIQVDHSDVGSSQQKPRISSAPIPIRPRTQTCNAGLFENDNDIIEESVHKLGTSDPVVERRRFTLRFNVNASTETGTQTDEISEWTKTIKTKTMTVSQTKGMYYLYN